MMTDDLQTLSALISACLPQEGVLSTQVENLKLYRRESSSLMDLEVDPMLLSVVVQGSKQTEIAEESCRYGAGQCLLCSIAAPAVFHAIGVDREHPFLAFSLQLSLDDLIECAQACPQPPRMNAGSPSLFHSFAVFTPQPELTEAFVRLLKEACSASPDAFLTKLILKEVHYRLLNSPCRDILYALTFEGSKSMAVLKAVNYLKEHYAERVEMNGLAAMVNMSSSAFYRKFAELTGISPLQYQKRVRLQHAVFLLSSRRLSVNAAASAVGYESTTQFIREFRRQFGKAPLRYIKDQLTADA